MTPTLSGYPSYPSHSSHPIPSHPYLLILSHPIPSLPSPPLPSPISTHPPTLPIRKLLHTAPSEHEAARARSHNVRVVGVRDGLLVAVLCRRGCGRGHVAGVDVRRDGLRVRDREWERACDDGGCCGEKAEEGGGEEGGGGGVHGCEGWLVGG